MNEPVGLNNENELTTNETQTNRRDENVWSVGDYRNGIPLSGEKS